MSKPLVLTLDEALAADLGEKAGAAGLSVEDFTLALLRETLAGEEADRLSAEDLALIRQRLTDPGPLASPERTAAVLARLRS